MTTRKCYKIVNSLVFQVLFSLFDASRLLEYNVTIVIWSAHSETGTEGQATQQDQIEELNKMFINSCSSWVEPSYIAKDQPLGRGVFEASHQKLWSFQYKASNRNVAFVGGIDIALGRHDRSLVTFSQRPIPDGRTTHGPHDDLQQFVPDKETIQINSFHIVIQKYVTNFTGWVDQAVIKKETKNTKYTWIFVIRFQKVWSGYWKDLAPHFLEMLRAETLSFFFWKGELNFKMDTSSRSIIPVAVFYAPCAFHPKVLFLGTN